MIHISFIFEWIAKNNGYLHKSFISCFSIDPLIALSLLWSFFITFLISFTFLISNHCFNNSSLFRSFLPRKVFVWLFIENWITSSCSRKKQKLLQKTMNAFAWFISAGHWWCVFSKSLRKCWYSKEMVFPKPKDSKNNYASAAQLIEWFLLWKTDTVRAWQHISKKRHSFRKSNWNRMRKQITVAPKQPTRICYEDLTWTLFSK